MSGTMATISAGQGLTPPVVTLVGQARGYVLATETFPLTNTPVALVHTGVLPDGVAINLKVVTSGNVVLVENTDYVLVRGSGPGDVTTIARKSTSTALASGATVSVSYSFCDASYYTPKAFTDINSVQAIYGPAMVSTIPADPNASQVNSPLSMAATVAFANGAQTLLCVAVQPPVPDADPAVTLIDQYNAAFTQIASNPDAHLVVPVISPSSTDTTTTYTATAQSLAQAARTHAVNASAAGYGRIVFIGYDALFNDTTTPPDVAAQALNSNRSVLAWPFALDYYNANIGQTATIGGTYLAAAYAALLAAQQPNRGLTRLQVFGFVDIPSETVQEMTDSYKNTLSAAGVAVTEPGRTGGLVIRHGTSTDPGDVISREISIVRAFDLLYRMLFDDIDSAGLIGTPIDEDTTTNVTAVITAVLETAVSSNVIESYGSVTVTQESAPGGNPTAIDVTFTYSPFLPLNYISVAFTMDLSTGTVSSTSSSTTDTTD